MGRGLSPLQGCILLLLPLDIEESWYRPRQILEALKLPPTASNRAVLSRALQRLLDRGLVVSDSPQRCTQGHGFLYARSTAPS
jgi:hypothetical protein